MRNIECTQCAFINRPADEVCQRCGADLPVAAPARREDLIPQDAERSKETDAFYHPSIGQFHSVGSVISPTITLFQENILLITKIIFVIFAPFEIFKALSFETEPTDWRTSAGVFVMGLACKALVAPSLIYALVTVMRTGVAPSLTDSYRYGINRLGKLIVCVILAWSLQLIGFLLFVIPGIILALAFELVYPIAALENRGPVETLKRSYNLTQGYRWRILGAGIVFGLLCAIVGIPVTFVATFLGFGGIHFWPIDAALAMIVDVVNEATTVLSLVIYLSILSGTSSE